MFSIDLLRRGFSSVCNGAVLAGVRVAKSEWREQVLSWESGLRVDSNFPGAISIRQENPAKDF